MPSVPCHQVLGNSPLVSLSEMLRIGDITQNLIQTQEINKLRNVLSKIFGFLTQKSYANLRH